MRENELLLAISDIMDKKLKPIDERLNKLEDHTNNGFLKIESDMDNGFMKVNNDMDNGFMIVNNDMNNGFKNIHIILENEIRPDIKILAENYLPSAIRYEKSVMEFENIQSDIDLLKKVVVEHSEKLQKIS